MAYSKQILLRNPDGGTGMTTIERGFGFIEIANSIDHVFFHVRNLPPDIKKLVDVRSIGDISRIPALLPMLEFDLERRQRGSGFEAANIRLKKKHSNAVVYIEPLAQGKIKVKVPNSSDKYSCLSAPTVEEGSLFVCAIFPAVGVDRILAQNHWVIEFKHTISFREIHNVDNKDDLKNDEQFTKIVIEQAIKQIEQTQNPDAKIASIQNSYDEITQLSESLGSPLILVQFRKECADLIQRSSEFKGEAKIKALLHIQWPDICDELKNLAINKIRTRNIVSLDIELGINKIDQVGLWRWNNADLYQTDEEITAGINKLNEEHQNIGLIGHNIIDWDLPILKEKGLDYSENLAWDTLRIEALLDPLKPSFALDTEHGALADAEKTFHLFINQVLCIATNESSKKRISGIGVDRLWGELVTEIIDLIANLGLDPLSLMKLHEEVKKESASFFRQKDPSTLAKKVQGIIQKQPEAQWVIVAPKICWPDIAEISNIHFIDSSSSDYSKQLVSSRYSKPNAVSGYGACLLDALVAEIRSTGKERSLSDISHWIRKELEKEDIYPEFRQLLDETQYTPTQGHFCCIGADFLVESLRHPRNSSSPSFLLLFPELEGPSSKRLIAQRDIIAADILLNKYDLWAAFSQSQSLFLVEKDVEKILSEFGVSEEDAQALDQMWLERTRLGDLILWGKPENAADQLKMAYPQSAFHFEHLPNTSRLPKEPISYIKLGSETENSFQRLNPETHYRDRYWAGQLCILKRCSSDKPSILFIRHKEETNSIIEIARALGYYIPSAGSMARNFELASMPRHKSCLLVFDEQSLPLVLRLYSEQHSAFDFFFEALPLHEQWITNNQIQDLIRKPEDQDLNPLESDTSYDEGLQLDSADEDIEEPENQEDKEGSGRRVVLKYDLLSAVQAVFPLLTYVYQTIKAKHADNRLVILDPRLQRINSLPNEPRLIPIELSSKITKKEYDETLTRVQNHIRSVQPLEEVEISEDLFTTLEHVFLKDKGLNGKPGSFKEEQKDFIEKVIERKQDVLVSLPTGGGKSVCFQGPALYRGLRTGRLTLVISPLKALMLDQVESLWNLGFYNSVDLITSDQTRYEIQDIYRRLAGGEISFLFVAPERFRARQFMRSLEYRLSVDKDLEYWVFDEAHCISQWGLDFRPDYRNAVDIVQIKRTSGHKAPIIFVSATVTEQVFSDIEAMAS